MYIMFGQLCDGLSLLSKKVTCPLNLDLSQQKGKFQFLAPSSVRVIGGYLLGTLSKPHPTVDLSILIPTVSGVDYVPPYILNTQ